MFKLPLPKVVLDIMTAAAAGAAYAFPHAAPVIIPIASLLLGANRFQAR